MQLEDRTQAIIDVATQAKDGLITYLEMYRSIRKILLGIDVQTLQSEHNAEHNAPETINPGEAIESAVFGDKFGQ